MAKEKQSSGDGNHDWYEKGRRLSHNGSHWEAIEVLNLAITENPRHAEAYFVRGACQYALGNYREAGDDLDAAAVLGCREAQFWSKHPIHSVTKDTDDGQENKEHRTSNVEHRIMRSLRATIYIHL